MHHLFHLSIHHALHLSLHPSMHHPFHLSIHQTMNIRKSWTNSLVLIIPSQIMTKIPNNITLTLHQAKFLEETPGTSNGAKYPDNFPLTQELVQFVKSYLQNYVLVFQVMLCTMRCAHRSINEILLEWDPGPTYLVQRLWDPGGPSYRSRSHVHTDLEKLGKLKSYLYFIHLPGLSSLPSQVTKVLNLAPNHHLGKLDCMGSFRYLPRLDQ